MSAAGRRKRLLISGGSGLLGAAILERWRGTFDTTALTGKRRIACPGVENVPADLAAPDDLSAVVERARPDVVVHCAAWTNVNACEANPRLARTIHRDATAAMASGAEKCGAVFVYISTDSLFSHGRGPHREEDPVAPRTVYAQTKLEGERRALELSARALVIRTCIIGWNAQPKASLTEWILGELRAGRAVKGFTDVSFSPILTTTLAAAIERLLAREARGVLHVGGGECLTKHDFAVKVAEVFELPRRLVVPATAGEDLRVPRPPSPCLDSSRYAALTGDRLESVEDALREMRQQEATGYRDRLRELIA